VKQRRGTVDCRISFKTPATGRTGKTEKIPVEREANKTGTRTEKKRERDQRARTEKTESKKRTTRGKTNEKRNRV
jgi:hypothetical protein